MGSSGGGAGSNDRWWENPKLSPADLRQHSESWSLADDAAMATLLQGISQRLVARTHEVEGALERSLEDADRLVTTIANTNNAFHMLANTQFIENRTYQDDADLVREKKEVSEKPAVTEEDIIGRCKTAIADGLSLVASCYERHEIQDSDSDDEDSPGSPVPVYALIDPYENKPLPLIIGSEAFMADDKVGLEVSSSEENSRMTFSPEDTESEAELEDETDRVTLQSKALPTSSSRPVDDSDSDWSIEEDGPLPNIPSGIVGKEKPLQLSSDEDDDMFGPPSRNSEKVGNIFSKTNNTGAATPTTHVNSRRTDLDSDSEEEGLFGKQQRSSSLFDGPRQPSNSQGSIKNSDPLLPPAPAKSLGVENVRAMPDAIPVKASAPAKSKKIEANLFASDSDDEGDLFSSKPAAPSGRSTNNVSHSQGGAPVSSSGGLFSSDEDSPVFSGPTSTLEPNNSRDDKEEPPPLPKESGRKVPVGGVSIFGTAITKAIRQQHSSDEEPSDTEVPSATTTKVTQPSPPKPDNKASQKPAGVKMPIKGGLFDSDDDENLFDTLVTKPASVANDVKTHSGGAASLENKTKADDKRSHIDNESTSNLSGKDSTAKSTGGLFSDEEDSIFGIPTTVKSKDTSSPANKSLAEKSTKVTKESTKAEGQAVKASRPSSLFTPPDYSAPSQPVNISEPPKSNISLFSSPSDDDDDIFSSISKPVQKASHASAFMTDPPPLPPQASNSEAKAASKGLPQLGAHDDSNKSTKASLEEKPKESLSASLFSSTSDEDIFSSVTTQKNSPKIATPEVNKEKAEFSKSGEEPELGAKMATVVSSKSTSHAEVGDNGGIFGSPTEDIFKPISQPPKDESKQGEIIKQSDEAKESPAKSLLKKDTTTGAISKNDNIFGSTDDLFGIPEKSDKPDDDSSNKKEENSQAPLKPEKQQTNSTTTSMVPGDSSKADSRLHKEISNSVNEITLPPSPASPESKPSDGGAQKPRVAATKPPVGGVALFGGKELAAQINKRKTLLEPAEEKEQKTENLFADIQESVSESEDHSKALIFDDSDDDIFGNNAQNLVKSTASSLFSQSPPLLPGESENTPKQQKPQNTPLLPGESENISKKQEPQIPPLLPRESENISKKQEPQIPPLLPRESENISKKQEPQIPPLLPRESENIPKKQETQIPPLLPGESENIPKKQELEKLQIPQPKPINLDNESKKSQDIDSDQQKSKPEKSEEENKEENVQKEIKPRKKPPIGGVSMFGSGGMGGSELFAKVLQRKSMLAPESDSSDEDTSTEPTGATKATMPAEEKSTAQPKPVIPVVSPVSPLSPLSPISPVFAPDSHEPKSGGVESSVSFDDPASNTNVLQSMNKTRARGSIKRRPPSRAHRKGGAEKSDPSDTQESTSTTESHPSASSTASSLEHTNTDATDVSKSKTEPLQSGERSLHPSADKDQEKIPRDVGKDKTEPAPTNMPTVTSNKDLNYNEGSVEPVVASHDGKKNVAPTDNKDVLSAPKSALGVLKSSSKPSSSLFGGSDSDEDLFGEVKPKKNVKKPLTSSGETNVTKAATKSSRSHSLFEDDDDDDASIFSSKSETKKVTAGASRNMQTTKPKGNLKQSSEPFEDPLLGSLTK
ncbi:hypothetical protein O3P69_016932 [Scylla paramamosain]|uniref:FAM21/CAPZIP domain-containing protein n=1 Tax=Scylla paramamosain TaxID=85552 RepID=A0AAW0TUA5_SCYPA